MSCPCTFLQGCRMEAHIFASIMMSLSHVYSRLGNDQHDTRMRFVQRDRSGGLLSIRRQRFEHGVFHFFFRYYFRLPKLGFLLLHWCCDTLRCHLLRHSHEKTKLSALLSCLQVCWVFLLTHKIKIVPICHMIFQRQHRRRSVQPRCRLFLPG